jgi:hypothetical protein
VLVELWVGDVKIKTKSPMNVLGVIFDTKTIQKIAH